MINMYIYKITFESGKTYVGERTYKCNYGEEAITDTYMSSSHYKFKHPEDLVIKKEILIEHIKDRETMDFLETYCIMSDKAYMGNLNVNGNWGGWINKWGDFLTDEEKVLWKKHLSEAYHRLTPEQKKQREIKRIESWRKSFNHETYSNVQKRLNANPDYRKKHSVTKNMTDEQFREYQDKMRCCATKLKEVICIETNETFISTRLAAQQLKIGRNKLMRALSNGVFELNGLHYRYN